MGSKKVRLKPDTTLAIAGQIADALGSAHEKDIVRRGRKPANIKVTPVEVDPDARPTRVNVVLNWQEELRRLEAAS